MQAACEFFCNPIYLFVYMNEDLHSGKGYLSDDKQLSPKQVTFQLQLYH